MTQKVYLVICNSGDGSSHLEVYKYQTSIDLLQKFANDGDDTYASGDGLQVTELIFSDEFALDAWVKLNFYGYSDDELTSNIAS